MHAKRIDASNVIDKLRVLPRQYGNGRVDDGNTTIVTVDERVTALEIEFRTELRHLATKADLHALENRLMLRLGGLMVALFSVAVAVLKFWS